MKARLISALALAATVAVGTAGCAFITPQATTYEYAPSDGVSVNAGDVKVRNALFIVNDDNSVFNLTMTTVNDTDSEKSLVVTLVIGGERMTKEVAVPPRLTQFGNPEKGQETVTFDELDARAGETIKTFFEADYSGEVEQYVPVLDGTLVEYKPYVLN